MKFLLICLPLFVFSYSCRGLSELDQQVKSHAEIITNKPISRSDLMQHFNLKKGGQRTPSSLRGGSITMSETWLLNSAHQLTAYKRYRGITTAVAEPTGVFHSPVNFERSDYPTTDYTTEKEFDNFYIIDMKGKKIFPEE